MAHTAAAKFMCWVVELLSWWLVADLLYLEADGRTGTGRIACGGGAAARAACVDEAAAAADDEEEAAAEDAAALSAFFLSSSSFSFVLVRMGGRTRCFSLVGMS
jgi:hypothetical protein